VKAALIDTPVVMVTRPRQCGKTTRVRGFTSHRYITLDDDTVL
jgi:predicted AAA+ superfamily ATPase